MSAWEEKYRSMTPTSQETFSESCRYHVNGVSHNIRYFDPYPFVVQSSEGNHLEDVDGNKYTDYWMGHWSLILGHKPHTVHKAMVDQLESGWMYGTVNEPTIRLSRILHDTVPAAEKLRYVASGTEAAMYAVRLARAATGRKIIVKMDGGWHGYTSDLLKTVNWPFSEPESTGCTGDDNIVSVPYNDVDKTLDIMGRVREDIAGVIMEPLLGGGGGIPATPEYLHTVQDYVKGCGGLFMLDEIVTGFRLRRGCIYQDRNLDPDIVTLGKVVGGGMPLGVICGKEDVMSLADTYKMSRNQRCYVGGGTFSAHPVSMVAGAATLSALNQDAYSRINRMGQNMRDALRKTLGDRVSVTGEGSLFMVHFLDKDISAVNNATDTAHCNHEMLQRYHKYLMTQGIFFLPGKMGAISTAHSDSDIRHISETTERFVSTKV